MSACEFIRVFKNLHYSYHFIGHMHAQLTSLGYVDASS